MRRLRLVAAAVVVLAAAGCRTTTGGGETAMPQEPSLSPYTVVFRDAEADSDIADRSALYCAQFGRLPVVAAAFVMDGRSFVQVDCVTADDAAASAPAQAPAGTTPPQAVPLVPAVAGG